MKKAMVWALIGAMALSLCACSSSNSETEGVSETISVDGETEAAADAGTDAVVTLGKASDYGEVTLGEYKGLKADRTVYEVTDEDVDYEVENLIAEYTEYNVVDRAAAEGDVVELAMTGSIGDEIVYDFAEEGYELYLGYEDLGAEFDEKITGTKAGDELQFSIAYDENDEYANYPGETIDYVVTVTAVEEEVVPELTEDFIKNTLGYASEDEMRQQLKDELQQENDEQSDSTVKEDLLQQVIDGSEFGSYNEELYQSTYESVLADYEQYMSWYGCETMEELLDMFEMTEDDLKDEALTQIYRNLVVYAIAENEGITLTDEEYAAGLQDYVDLIGYETTADLIADYGNESLSYWIFEEKVLDFLYDNAEITDVVETTEEEDEIVG